MQPGAHHALAAGDPPGVTSSMGFASGNVPTGHPNAGASAVTAVIALGQPQPTQSVVVHEQNAAAVGGVIHLEGWLLKVCDGPPQYFCEVEEARQDSSTQDLTPAHHKLAEETCDA